MDVARRAELDDNKATAEDFISSDVSATGSLFQDTPMIVPTREHLDLVKKLLTGDIYVGRGSRQRQLPKSRFCNVFKVS